MKAQKDFILRNLAGEYVLAPVGDRIKEFDGLVLMNELSAFIWEKLQRDVSREELIAAILEDYNVDAETCARDLDAALEEMRKIGVVED